MLTALLWILTLSTLACWCVPMLFLPHPVLRALHIPINEPVLFVRLVGAAGLALAMLYFLGALRAHDGHNVSDVVIVGLVHCGMSAAVIWRYALHGHYQRWPQSTRLYIHGFGGLMSALALALLVVGMWRG